MSEAIPSISELIARDAELEARRNAAVAALERAWQPLPPRSGLSGWLERRLFGPLLARQQAYNTAALEAIYRINELADQRRSLVYRLITELDATAERAGRLEQHARAVERQFALLGEVLADMEEADAQLLAAIGGIDGPPPTRRRQEHGDGA